jgi:5-methyltetrahydrofolate--homocysteine methyltransferase
MSELLKQIEESVIAGDGPGTKGLAAEALEAGVAAGDILKKALMPGMEEVGRRMKDGEYYIPEVLISARAMQMALEVLKPHLAASEVGSSGTVVIGTVKGDLHDIGKNLVRMMFEGAGFNVVDLGTDVAAEKFVSAAQENNADIVGMSALLTTTMTAMKDAVQAFEDAGIRDRVKIMVGGAPVTKAYAKEIGADGYAPDAGSVVAAARALLAA